MASTIENTDSTVPAKRKAGRRQSGEGPNINRNTILRTALKLTTKTPLQEVSILNVARTMEITPALVHYYIGGREWLTSGTMNLFYKGMLRAWPEPTGIWQKDLIAAARLIHGRFSAYPGIAAYAVSNARFRLCQLTAFGDREYGLEVIERVTGCVRGSGLPSEQTGIYSSQLFELAVSTANALSNHIYPKDHKAFLREKARKLDPGRYPHIEYAGGAPLAIGSTAFDEGCKLILLGIEHECSGKSLPELD